MDCKKKIKCIFILVLVYLRVYYFCKVYYFFYVSWQTFRPVAKRLRVPVFICIKDFFFSYKNRQKC